MVIVKSEFALALNQVASERGISVDDVIESMEAAIMAAFRKEHPEFFSDDPEEDNGISVKIDINTGETHIMREEEDITPPGFGRIAAQTARQVIIQKIREAEKKTVISHYQDQVGTIIRGRVIRRDMSNVYIDLGKAEGVLPREEQIRNETYIVNNRYVFYLKEIGTSKAGYSRIVLSRTAPELISELFKREVPEINSGTVEIKSVVREPGERAKIAVFSSQSGVDPVGACVGQKGVRVQTVTDELNGKEKIDIIQWNEDNKVFIISALSPAQVISVEIDEKEHRAKVTVNEEQAPLAIGKGGVNVNLAARLTGYDIDIVQIPSEKDEKKAEAAEEKQPEASESVESEQGEEATAEQSAETEAAKTEHSEETEEADASEEKSKK
ncbi:transcription termination factor NusA [Candidatus Roizmanbacteria bacterium]|nr:MAG: transcription termination factor NusA [Candidatus Roizmanbacteria bacterium]